VVLLECYHCLLLLGSLPCHHVHSTEAASDRGPRPQHPSFNMDLHQQVRSGTCFMVFFPSLIWHCWFSDRKVWPILTWIRKFTWRTLLSDFTPIWFERTEPNAFLKRLPPAGRIRWLVICQLSDLKFPQHSLTPVILFIGCMEIATGSLQNVFYMTHFSYCIVKKTKQSGILLL